MKNKRKQKGGMKLLSIFVTLILIIGQIMPLFAEGEQVPTSIEVQDLHLQEGQSSFVNYLVKDQNGIPIPSGAYVPYFYTLDNDSIQVNGTTGEVTALAYNSHHPMGGVSIGINGYPSVYGLAMVYVSQDTTPASIMGAGSMDIDENQSDIPVTIYVYNQYGQPVTSGYTLDYISSDPSVFTVDSNGSITTKAYIAGHNTATLTVSVHETAISKDITININQVQTAPTGHNVTINTDLGSLVELDGIPQLTDQNGQVVFPNTSIGPHTVRITKEGYLTYVGTVNVVDQDIVVSITLNAATIHFTVKTAGEGYLAHLESISTLTGDPISLTVISNLQGNAEFDIPEATYNLAVSKEGFESYTGTVNVSQANNSFEITLNPTTQSTPTDSTSTTPDNGNGGDSNSGGSTPVDNQPITPPTDPVIPPSNNGGSGNSTPVETPTPTPTPVNPSSNGGSGSGNGSVGSIVVTPTPVPTPEVITKVGDNTINTIVVDGKVETKISGNTITEELSKQTESNSEIPTVVINVEKIQDSTIDNYNISIEKPTESDTQFNLQINTPIGNIIIPSPVLNNQEDTIKVSISGVENTIDPKKPAVTFSITDSDNKPVSLSNDEKIVIKVGYTPTPEEEKSVSSIVAKDITNPEDIIISNYNPIAKEVTVVTYNPSGTYEVYYSPVSFKDLDSASWCKEAVNYLAARGIVVGVGKNMFNPNENVTRAEFVVMLTRAKNSKVDFKDNFSDVTKTAYYYNAVGVAKELGYIEGIGNNLFDPNSYITRQDICTILHRVLIIEKIDFSKFVKDISKYQDSKEISAYALEGVKTLSGAGLIKGYDNKLYPKKSTTRAECAQIIYNMLKEFYIFK